MLFSKNIFDLVKRKEKKKGYYLYYLEENLLGNHISFCLI